MDILAIDELERAEAAMLSALTESLVQTRRSVAGLQALETQILAAAVEVGVQQARRRRAPENDLPMRSIAAEFAAAVRISDRSMQRQLSDAWGLVDRFPATLDALAGGAISRGHVAVIVEAGMAISDADARAESEQAVIRVAEAETPARLRPIARALAERSHPRSLNERHLAVRVERRIEVRDLDDGMAELLAVLPAMLAHGIHDRLTQMAHDVKAATVDAETAAAGVARPDLQVRGGQIGADSGGDAGEGDVRSADAKRGMDELRADVLCDLLLGGAPVAHGEGLDAIRAEVQLTVPVLTLLGHGDDAPLLDRYGPIDTRTARHLTARAPGWDRVLADPVSGNVLAVDRYRPTTEMRRFLRVRDETCRFPGCRMPAVRCDIDHTCDHAHGGATSLCNLAHMCRRHHVLKHASDWRVEQLGDGRLRWMSPTGRVYIDTPAPVLRFTPSDPWDSPSMPSSPEGAFADASPSPETPGAGRESAGAGRESAGAARSGSWMAEVPPPF